MATDGDEATGGMRGGDARTISETGPTPPPGRAGVLIERLLPAVLSVPSYRRLWYYALLFFHANTFENVVAGWAVLVLTGSPLAVGLVGFCRALPMFVLGLVLSAVAERFPGGSVLLGVQVTSFLGAAALAALFTFGHPSSGRSASSPASSAAPSPATSRCAAT